MRIFSKILRFLKEVKIELKKVSWSNREELIEATWVVIVTTTLLGLFIGLVDLILSKVVSLVFK